MRLTLAKPRAVRPGIERAITLVPFISIALAATPMWAQAYRFARVWDGKKTIAPAIIVVEGDRIKSVAAVTGASANPIIDMSKYTAIPGMIDVHTHMTYVLDQQALAGRPRRGDRLSLAGQREKDARNRRDHGSQPGRERLRRHRHAGPDQRRNDDRSAHVRLRLRPAIPRERPRRTGNCPWRNGGRCKVVKRQQVDAGADVIKMYGSTGSGQDVSGDQTFTYEEMKAGRRRRARAAGKKIAMHTYGPAGARDAVRAGADSIEHATDMDDDTIAEMARKKSSTFRPSITIAITSTTRSAASLSAGRDRSAERFHRAESGDSQESLRAGVRFAMGSDAVYTMFGENTRELAWFVKAGMTPEQALQTATINGAALLGMEDKLGALKPGYFADIVAVEGDPLADINAAINKVKWVMKGGAVVVDKTK
jgi:imidazolonepropionase-like amidohydrolase